MALIVILAAVAILSGIPTLIRYLNRKKDGIETNAVVSRIDWFPEDENDHDYYYFVKFTDENGKYRFSLECKQVRSRVMQNGRVEVGCVVVNPPQALSQYVAFKQLAEKRRMLGE